MDALDWALEKANEIAPCHIEEWPLESREMRQESVEALATAIANALRDERERCAKVADEWAADGDWDPDCCRGIAAQIRDPEPAKPQL